MNQRKLKQQQYPAGIQAKGKNKFINNTFHQYPKPPVSIGIFQITSTSS